MLDICTLGEEVLRENCENVTVFDHALEILVDAMYDTLEEADGIGLAGPQVAVPQRLFIVSIPSEGIKKTFINPEIVETSVETSPYEEGCLSLPGVYHDVIRPSRVTVYAQDVKGKAFKIEADGLLARVIQHEYDHLDGKLFIDRIPEEESRKVVDRYTKLKSRGERKKRR